MYIFIGCTKYIYSIPKKLNKLPIQHLTHKPNLMSKVEYSKLNTYLRQNKGVFYAVPFDETQVYLSHILPKADRYIAFIGGRPETKKIVLYRRFNGRLNRCLITIPPKKIVRKRRLNELHICPSTVMNNFDSFFDSYNKFGKWEASTGFIGGAKQYFQCDKADIRTVANKHDLRGKLYWYEDYTPAGSYIAIRGILSSVLPSDGVDNYFEVDGDLVIYHPAMEVFTLDEFMAKPENDWPCVKANVAERGYPWWIVRGIDQADGYND